MKITVNKSAKRVISLVLALVMLVGSLFTANIGVNISADAESTAELKISYWTGNATAPDVNNTDANGNILISTADELCAVAFNLSGTTSNYGTKFKIDNSKVDVIVLQKEADVIAAGGVEKLMSLSSGDETKAFFEKMDSKTDWFSKFNWKVYNATSFDGSNVPIYGLYSVGATSQGKDHSIGLFASTDTGTPGTSDTEPATDATGIFYKNIVLKNSYMVSGRRLAAIVPMTNGSGYGAYVNGFANFNNCVVANNYLCCEASNANYSTGAAGIFLGNCDGGDAVKIDSCIAYGNNATHVSYDKTTVTPLSLANTSESTATVSNTIAIGTSPSYQMGSKCTYTNVYTDQTASDDGITYISARDAKGALGKAIMSTLNWASDATEGTWHVIANDYPLPYKPAGWKDITALTLWDGPSISTASISYDKGDGTKENPYIISNANQLWKMVKEASYAERLDATTVTDYNGAYTKADDGTISETANFTPAQKTFYNYTPKYYKVADGVSTIYISGSADRNWSTGTWFYGNFDGNGATIYGLYSTGRNGGFVYGIDGMEAEISNVVFDSAYINSTSYASVITNNVGSYQYGYFVDAADHYDYLNTKAANGANGVVPHESFVEINNVAIVNSNISTTITGTTSPTAAGFIATANTPDMVTFNNCLYDGGSCTLSSGKGTDGKSSTIAGFASIYQTGNDFTFNNCVSIGAHIVPMVSGIQYARYCSEKTGKIILSNCYSDINPEVYNALTNYGYEFDRITIGASEIKVATEGVYDSTAIPGIDWLNAWSPATLDSGRVVPMPNKKIEGALSYNEVLSTQNEGRGANAGRPYADGTYGMIHEFNGSGTETDPYIIKDALDLARAIGCGGINLNQALYFKLACDIDLTGHTWINQMPIAGLYAYVPFKGVLDGDGHSIFGLSAIGRDGAGLIPVIDGGTVKNVHIVDSYVGSQSTVQAGVVTGIENSAGAIVGTATANGGTIEGCSVTNTTVANTADTLIGTKGSVVINNSYTEDKYYVSNAEGTPEVDGTIWYQGGGATCKPQLVSRAQAMPFADLDGDGLGYEYGAADLVALRSRILRRSAYANVYGDVNGDSNINIIDLAIVRRQMGDDYGLAEDGFWPAVANGKMAIYYSENDTMDMARKMQIYLEAAVPGVEIAKYATVIDDNVADGITGVTDPTAVQGSPDGMFDIVLVEDNTKTYSDYTVAYDQATAVLTITGGSFTAVEQAVIAFVQGSNPDTNTLYEGSGAIDTTTMASKTVGGKTYYYAWGDEFNDTSGVDTDKWAFKPYKTETHTGDDGFYLNKENPNVSDLEELYETTSKSGWLKIWRGVNLDATDTSILSDDDKEVFDAGTYTWGYKGLHLGTSGTTDFGNTMDANDVFVDPAEIVTSNTMLFKQGYIEMKASLPGDGHAFPAWWFLTSTTPKNNYRLTDNLYHKVYKYNDKTNNTFGTHWQGAENTVANDLSTYRYQIPAAHLEFDIVELMQAQQGSYTLTGNYLTNFDLTIHKIYNENVYNDTVYIPNWSTGTTSAVSSFTSTTSGQHIHRYNPSNFADAGSNSNKSEYDFSKITTLTGEHIYGFAWNADESDGTYDVTVYVDGTAVLKVDQTVGHEDTNDPIYYGQGKSADAAIWNQYAYMLLDNSYYTSNPSYNSGITNYTDLLAQKVNGYVSMSEWNATDKATMEIDYVRVYQQNGMRDIVTSETENFNNGNRFGYGQ